MSENVVRVAVPVPLYRCFDYLIAHIQACPCVGARVLVPFGRRELVGVVVATNVEASFSRDKLKSIKAVIDDAPLFDDICQRLFQFASDYYVYALGEIYHAAMPTPLRQGSDVSHYLAKSLTITADGLAALDQPMRAKKQLELLQHLTTAPIAEVDVKATHSSAVIKALLEKKYASWQCQSAVAIYWQEPLSQAPIAANVEQQVAIQAMLAATGFKTWLLEGVTGSGKTEVYMQVMASILKKQQRILVLIPEIALTPQTLNRFVSRFSVPVACLHSGLSHGERTREWLRAKRGDVAIVLGTRSSILAPIPNLGLIVVDEEHDSAFVQQTGFRYCARSMAIMRAKLANCPVVLGSATPSLQSLANVEKGLFNLLQLQKRAAGHAMPACELVDIKGAELEWGLCERVKKAMAQHLAKGHQVLVFLNRRGFAPVLLCHHCGYREECEHCQKPMTWHDSIARLLCHHCGARKRAPRHCPDCQQSELETLGMGTEQLEVALSQMFPDARVARVDRDTTRQKGALSDVISRVNAHEVDILLGTQMLAKGHHFSKLNLVVMLDMDSGLYSADLSAMETLGQLILQVAGRAGRDGDEGEVLIQTHEADHPLLNVLLKDGYDAFAQSLLKDRRETQLPPYAYLAYVVVEAHEQRLAQSVLQELKLALKGGVPLGVQVVGPMPSIMEKRAGWFAVELMILSQERQSLHHVCQRAVSFLSKKRLVKKARWHLQLAS